MKTAISFISVSIAVPLFCQASISHFCTIVLSLSICQVLWLLVYLICTYIRIIEDMGPNSGIWLPFIVSNFSLYLCWVWIRINIAKKCISCFDNFCKSDCYDLFRYQVLSHIWSYSYLFFFFQVFALNFHCTFEHPNTSNIWIIFGEMDSNYWDS